MNDRLRIHSIIHRFPPIFRKPLLYLNDLRRGVLRFFRFTLYYLFRIFPIDTNKIFVINFNGHAYGDNPKYVIDEILKKNSSYDIVWSVKKNIESNFPKGVRVVYLNSIKSIYEEVTSRIWIDNTRKQPYVRKRKKQFYVQTWHGGIGIKKAEKDVEEKLSPSYVKQAINDSKMIDILISNSTFVTKQYKRAYWYDGEIFETGYPKNDILINNRNHIKQKIYQHYNIDRDKKLVLYAPTFRNNNDETVYDLDYQQILKTLKKTSNTEWIFLVRLHPNISENSKLLTYADNIINGSFYNDMQELLAASDMLITDYSSCMFDFMFMRRPVFLYINDYEKYLADDRGFYFDIFSLPFSYAFNNTKLINKITNYDDTLYKSKAEMFANSLGLFEEGKASVRIVDRIVKETHGKGLVSADSNL